jgi:hypothetical protein
MSPRRRTAAATLLLLSFSSWSVQGRERRRAILPGTHVLAVTVIGATQLSPAAHRGMLGETTRIWRHEGVNLIWNSDTADTRGLRAVFVQAALRSPESKRWLSPHLPLR